jgi:hypothetical protein
VDPSVSSLSSQWLDIKMTLAEDRGKRRDPIAHGGWGGANLDEFNAALNRFFASPAGSLYLVHRPGIAQSAALIGGNTEQLKEAVKAGDETRRQFSRLSWK